ncbi:MAG: adenylate/guanylate cyclase domain-containing protein [Candidatus Bipolaricaulia bacterium]
MPWDQWWFWIIGPLVALLVGVPVVFILSWTITEVAKSLRGDAKETRELREQVSELREELAEARAMEKVFELQRQLTEQEEQQLKKHVLNSGVAVIGFTDIEGFSTYADQHGDQAASELLSQHNQIVRSALQRHNGLEIKQLGDGFMVSFASAHRALQCMTEIQDEIQRLQREQGLDLNVRIGIHAGETIHEEQDVIGRTVNMAERIMSTAHGGQVFVSDVVRNLAGPVPSLEYVDQGDHHLKGFDEPLRLYEIRPVPEASSAG